MSRATPRPVGRLPRIRAKAISKDGYKFWPADDHWQLNKDVRISLELPDTVSSSTKDGFRKTLQRYAEEASARHTENMSTRFKRFVRDTGSAGVTPVALINWRGMLGVADQWHLGSLKGFLLAWHDYGFQGVPKETVDLLLGWTLKGNEKGAAVACACPETGPFTDLEIAALLDWANAAVTTGTILFEDYAYLLTLVLTARRPVQIAALRGRDLVRDSEAGGQQHLLSIPRAKQRGARFRGEFRSLPIHADLFLVLNQQWQNSVAFLEAAFGIQLSQELALEVPIFVRDDVSKIKRSEGLQSLLSGPALDLLHAPTRKLADSLRRCGRATSARSERTGEHLRLSASRFRRTRGTKLRREGFGAHIIAELLDHSDVQNVRIYTENTAQEAVVIDELIGAKLAPFAQACLGRLVFSEREAIRGNDPRSRVASDRLATVGTCGSYGFCASGYRACYTCHHFQPWVNGPHREVLADLHAERRRVIQAGCADVVAEANDQLILAVEHCVLMCAEAVLTDDCHSIDACTQYG